MDSKSLYTKLTYNIEKKISQFQTNKIQSIQLNEQLLLNVTSLCRFLKNREEAKKLVPNQDCNETILDVFVPFSRLSSTLQRKFESMQTEVISEEKEFEKELEFGCEIGNGFEEDDDELFSRPKGSNKNNMNNNNKKDLDSLLDNDDIYGKEETMKESNNYFDDNQSISMSLFNQPLNLNENDLGFSKYKNQFSSTSNTTNTQLSGKQLVKADSLKSPASLEDLSATLTFKSEKSLDEEKNKEIKDAIELFKGILKEKVIIETVKDMSLNYLQYIHFIYQKMKSSCDPTMELCEHKSLVFINQFKSFVLEIGISDKKFYEQCIREIIYNKNMFEFSEFLECFRKLLNLKFDQTFLKYKFLFHITQRQNEDYFELDDLNKFYDLLLKCRKIYEPEIYEDIRNNLIDKYQRLFPNSDKLYTRQLSLVLETFFDLK